MEKGFQGMNIFIVCPRLCHGGAERVAVSLANGFVNRGHRVLFFTDLFEEQSYVLNETVALYNLVSVPLPKVRKWVSAIWILRKAIKKEKPDVIVGIMPTCSLISRIASLGLNTTVIASEHNVFERPDSSPMSLWGRVYKFHISKVFKWMTVLTKTDKKVLGGRKNVVVMPNPLAITPIVHVPEKKRIVLAAGRLDDWHCKGFDVLIRAWARVVSSVNCHDSSISLDSAALLSEEPELVSPWRLQIAGVCRDSRTKEYLDSIAMECGVSGQIDYLGFVDDMKSLYQDASIFVLSSRFEGFGLVLIEAMSQGCACVACDYKGRQREIFGELKNEKLKSESVEVCKNGILCEPDNVEALAEGIKRMMEGEAYRKKVQKNSIERASFYQIDQIIARWEMLMSRIIIKS